MSNNTGGPAFPHRTGSYGMTLRDYFAAKAMQALIPESQAAIARSLLKPEQLANAAYEFADMMLKERKK